MPFVLTNTPDTFQCNIDVTLFNALLYPEIIVVFSNTSAQHPTCAGSATSATPS